MSGRHVLWTARRTSGTVARIVLAESGLDHETRFIDVHAGEHRTAAFRATNPKGQVPALSLPDGSVLTEGPAIQLHVARMAPGSGLMPADALGQARVMEWLCWCAWTLGRTIQPAFLPDRFVGEANAVGPVRDAARARFAEAMAHADRALGERGTLLGTEAPTAPDHYLMILAIFASRLGLDLSGHARLLRHRTTIAARPRVAAILADEGLP